MIDQKMMRLVLGIVLLFSCIIVNAQPGPPPTNPVPITGIEILVGAGALLGAKRMVANRKKNN